MSECSHSAREARHEGKKFIGRERAEHKRLHSSLFTFVHVGRKKTLTQTPASRHTGCFTYRHVLQETVRQDEGLGVWIAAKVERQRVASTFLFDSLLASQCHDLIEWDNLFCWFKAFFFSPFSGYASVQSRSLER